MNASRLRPFGDGLWLADGPAVYAFGFSFPTRMAVARLRDGALWLWSPIRLDDDLRREIANLGAPRYAVEPNKFHHLALAEWVRCWPEIRLYAPPGLRGKRRDLHFDAELTSDPPAEWRTEIDQVRVEGSIVLTEVLFFHRPSSTCLVGDLIEKHDDQSVSGWRRWLMRAGGVAGPSGSTARGWRLSFVHRDRARRAISRALAWQPQRLVIAHGPCAEAHGSSALEQSMRWLVDGR